MSTAELPPTSKLLTAGYAPPRQQQTASPELLNGETWVEYFPPGAAVSQLSPEWDDLAANAVEPNVFLERWFVESATQSLNCGAPHVVAVYRRGKRQDVVPAMVGMFLFTPGRWAWTPVTRWRAWTHDYGFLNTPLIRRGHAVECLLALFQWIETLPGGPGVLEWPLMHAEGPVHQALIEATYRRRLSVWQASTHNRASLVCGVSADAVIETSMSSHQRQELRRQLRRLAEHGRVEFLTWPAAEGSAPPSEPSATQPQSLAAWIEAFFQVEAAGWKGAAQSALGVVPETREFFTTLAERAQALGTLRFLGLFLDGRPIAVKVNFLSGAGSFAFKIGFDEAFAKYSPGVQLELENIRTLHAEPGWRWMDSCAIPDHFMINRLWTDRRSLQHVLVSTGRRSGELMLGLLPCLRGLKRCWRRARPQS